jgi:hypothetical protein
MEDVQRSDFSVQEKIPTNKFDKFRESKGKIVYYGTQAKKNAPLH